MHVIGGVGWEADGAGLAVGNLDSDPRPDAILMAYDDPAGGTLIWGKSIANVAVRNGRFAVVLNGVPTLGGTAANNGRHPAKMAEPKAPKGAGRPSIMPRSSCEAVSAWAITVTPSGKMPAPAIWSAWLWL